MDFIPVTFRKFPEGDIIAIMPSIPARFGRFMSYQHYGQHGECDSELISQPDTFLATPEEYQNLLDELISIGYDNLKIYKKIPTQYYHWNTK